MKNLFVLAIALIVCLVPSACSDDFTSEDLQVEQINVEDRIRINSILFSEKLASELKVEKNFIQLNNKEKSRLIDEFVQLIQSFSEEELKIYLEILSKSNVNEIPTSDLNKILQDLDNLSETNNVLNLRLAISYLFYAKKEFNHLKYKEIAENKHFLINNSSLKDSFSITAFNLVFFKVALGADECIDDYVICVDYGLGECYDKLRYCLAQGVPRPFKLEK